MDSLQQQLSMVERQNLYLDALECSGSIGGAATTSGVPLGTVEGWDKRDVDGFKSRKAAALAIFMGKVELEINRRALEGIDKPLHYKGEIFGHERQFSDNLLMFRAKKLDPSYRDNYDPRPTHQEIKVTSITYNMPAGVAPPVQVPAPGLTVDGDVVELPDGVEPGVDAEASG